MSRSTRSSPGASLHSLATSQRIVLTPLKLGNCNLLFQIETKCWERGFEQQPKSLEHHFHIALTAVATVHFGKNTIVKNVKLYLFLTN